MYILNKNNFDYIFKLNRIHNNNRYRLNSYAIIDINKEIDIKEIERIVQLTKIVNKKIKKDIKNLDKIIYKTK